MTMVLSRSPSTTRLEYTVSVYDTIRDVDPDEWNRVRDPHADPFMDPGFVAAVENSLGNTCRFRPLLVRDEQGQPVAAACLCYFPVDAAVLANGFARRIANVINGVAPFLLRVPLLLVGLPVSCGASHLRFAPEADREAVLRLIDEQARLFARETKAKCIVFKEFESHECHDLQPLAALGYRQADSLPMNCVPAKHASFDKYLASIPSAKRRTIRKSREKFANSGLRVVHLRGGDGADQVYTEEVHKLYDGVLDRAKVRFERLPAEFFREIARQMPENSLFTYIFQGERVVAFAATVLVDEVFDQMFVGYDYELNPKCDLYFNLFFEAVSAAFQRGPRRIYVGQTSDEFKHQKLSSYQVPLSIYVKGTHPLVNTLIKQAFGLFFPPRPMQYPPL
ncbi:MAG TPA: GNAT family N-acetyltransferase [Planctomycetaceae bacterium]|jgi:predicted N-acyltransferase|nr:GNAT family N-acetyltransferase [Planctomycetaceae bacterium]